MTPVVLFGNIDPMKNNESTALHVFSVRPCAAKVTPDRVRIIFRGRVLTDEAAVNNFLTESILFDIFQNKEHYKLIQNEINQCII